MLKGANPKGALTTEKDICARTIAAPAGLQPQLGGRPPKKPEVRCDSNPVPEPERPARPARPADS